MILSKEHCPGETSCAREPEPELDSTPWSGQCAAAQHWPSTWAFRLVNHFVKSVWRQETISQQAAAMISDLNHTAYTNFRRAVPQKCKKIIH